MDNSKAGLKAADSEKGKIKHTDSLNKDIGAQFSNKETSDVTLIVESKSFYCHKIILAARSEYFRALLYGNMKESRESEIELKEISAGTFQLLINYIYTGKLDLDGLKLEMVIDILHLAHQFRFESLETDVSGFLEEVINVSNVFVILEKALLFELASLTDACDKVVDENANEIISNESFSKLSKHLLKKILQRDTFIVEEVIIFRAVFKWIKKNVLEEADIQEVLAEVRLPLIRPRSLANVVRPTKLFPDYVLFEAISTRKSGEIKLRGYSIVEENVADSKHGSKWELDRTTAKKINGKMSERYFNRVPGTYMLPNFKITLGKAFVINCIQIKQKNNFADPGLLFVVEKSIDGKRWFHVNNVVKYTCNYWYMLLFPKLVARYFRIFCPQMVNDFSDWQNIQCLLTKKYWIMIEIP